MTFVVDASVAVCWCYRDEQDERADAAYDLLRDGQALAPLHWWFELRNVLLIGERRQRISGEEVARFLGRVGELSIELVDLPASDAVLRLARKHRLAFYDAAYLELAVRERRPLATLDKALARAADAERVSLIGAP